jgi:monoamine oxidase
MGCLLKIAMTYEAGHPLMANAPNSILLAQTADQRGTEFLVRPFGAPMSICTVGGSLALDLESQPEKAQFAFAVECLRGMLGSKAEKGLKSKASTSWGRNPLYLGSVSSAKPGGLPAREALQSPINERVFLAGEAMGDKASQTVHGAYQSGRATAMRVLKFLSKPQPI